MNYVAVILESLMHHSVPLLTPDNFGTSKVFTPAHRRLLWVTCISHPKCGTLDAACYGLLPPQPISSWLVYPRCCLLWRPYVQPPAICKLLKPQRTLPSDLSGHPLVTTMLIRDIDAGMAEWRVERNPSRRFRMASRRGRGGCPT